MCVLFPLSKTKSIILYNRFIDDLGTLNDGGAFNGV